MSDKNFAVTYYQTPEEVFTNCNILGSKPIKNDILTLNYGFPSSFTTLSTCRTAKCGQGPLMKLNAGWALPVYPVFKDEKLNGSDKTSIKRKIALKKDQQD